MGKLKNIGTALSRVQTSKGFGVHSPFAYHFITSVLGEEYEYYSYERLQQLRLDIIDSTRLTEGYKPRVIPIGEAATLFRVANFFNPAAFLVIGSSYGMAAAALLMVNSRSQLVLYQPSEACNAAGDKALAANFAGRVTRAESIDKAAEIYKPMDGGQLANFVVINNVPDSDLPAAQRLVEDIATTTGVLIMRNIATSRNAEKLWQQCRAKMPQGMTFNNTKMAIAIINPKLPRQDFNLW